MKIGWDIFLRFYIYLILIPLTMFVFSIIYSLMPSDFVVNFSSSSSYKINAVNEVMTSLCKGNKKDYSLSISNGTCKYEYIKPIQFTNSVKGLLYTISDITLSFKTFTNEVLKLRYAITYDMHKNRKSEDVGIIEINYEHFNSPQKTILLNVTPYTSYPKGNPLYEIKKNVVKKIKLSGPYKGMDILSVGILNLKTDSTSHATPNGWPNFRVLLQDNIKNAYLLLHEGIPVFKAWFDRVVLFTYYSGITFMTVGYGDITPISTLARSLAILESFLGIVLLGLFSGSFFAHIVNLFSRPSKELENYLLDTENWTHSKIPQTGTEMYYYIPKPEFKIVISSDSQDFDEPWVKVYPDKKGIAVGYSIKYNDTILYNFRFILCDGGRGISIIPNKKVMYNGQGGELPFTTYYYLIKNSFQDKLNRLIQDKHDLSLKYQINYFKNEKEAEKLINKSYNSNQDSLICFRCEEEGAKQKLINRC